MRPRFTSFTAGLVQKGGSGLEPAPSINMKTQRQVGNRIGVARRGVDDRHAGGGAGLDINVDGLPPANDDQAQVGSLQQGSASTMSTR